MPNPMQFDSKKKFMKVCIPMMMEEGNDQDQAVAACSNMWEHRGDMMAEKQDGVVVTQDGNTTTYTILPIKRAAIKAVGDWELEVVPVPFGSPYNRDSDGQWFDPDTQIMEDVYSTPLVIYQHGVEQGAKDYQGKLITVGKSVPGTLTKRADGWHVRVILDKTVAIAKQIMDAARKGLVAVSSDSIAHLARLDIGGKLIPYEKDRPGRIAVWPLAGFSLWETGNGNFKPANRQAIAMPVMKAIYRDAGVPFPDVKTERVTSGSLSEAHKAMRDARKAEVIKQTKQYLEKLGEESK